MDRTAELVRRGCEHTFVGSKYSNRHYEAVLQCIQLGWSDRSIAAVLGISRTTIQNWRRRKPRFTPLTLEVEPWRPKVGHEYAYLLGAYLGDGHIWQHSPASWRLTVTLDMQYPGVVEEVARSIAMVDPGTTVRRNGRTGAVALIACSAIWPAAFPQHGPGRKHERAIQLVDWQCEITHAHPEALLRGLIHSDGSRCINRFKTKLPSGRVAEYAYPRYFFTNLSADIRRIFCDHCELLGIRWTQSNHKNISVSHRDSVALLDSFIGPKS